MLTKDIIDRVHKQIMAIDATTCADLSPEVLDYLEHKQMGMPPDYRELMDSVCALLALGIVELTSEVKE